MLLKKTTICILLAISIASVHAQKNTRKGIIESEVSEKLSLNKGWRFHLGDIPFPEIKGHTMSYESAKAGKAWGAASPTYNDMSWRLLTLPHDWAVEQTIDSNANVSQGYRNRGIGWYRRSFRLNPTDKGKNLELQFEGVSTHCTVWVNGTVVHRNWSGYTSFYIDISAIAKYGEEVNNIAIKVDALDQEGWWYEGAGIYRNTWIVKRAPVHIITDGVFANPIKDNKGQWKIPAEITLENIGKQSAPLDVELAIIDQKGNRVARGIKKISVDALDISTAKIILSIKNPSLWSIEKPTLYKAVASIKQNGILRDSAVTLLGFRTTRFDADSGFFLNEKHIKIKGVCNHQDHAGVGVAMPNSILEFRLKKLKDMGVNAYRCSHNPPSIELLDLCDKMGIMVMDENRNFNSSPEYMRQLEWMVRRDRNHPSIILWSVFNEEPMQGTENGYEMVRRMSAAVKKLDKSRPVTAAMNGGFFTPVNVSQAVDVVGFNYQIDSYDAFHKVNPKLPLTSSEDVSGLMMRGEYKTDTLMNLVDSYDTQRPAWGETHRNAWKAIAERPYLAGCFVWTGFDYRGEPTPYVWPTAGSNFGTMDVCGFPKTAFYIHRAQWNTAQNTIYIAPHWNWPTDSIGKPIKIMVISNAETVKLFLNDKLIGQQVVDKYEMNEWIVPYQPGKLEAIGYRNGIENSRYRVETTGKPVSIQLDADRISIHGDGLDALPITVKVFDNEGRQVPTANMLISFGVSGPGAIIGVGNGNPNSHEADKGNKRKLYNGLGQVILQTDEGASTPLILTASSPGLISASLTIPVIKKDGLASLAIVDEEVILQDWRLSHAFANRPDPNQYVSENDMNSWEPGKVGQLQKLFGGKYFIYRTKFTSLAHPVSTNSQLIVKNITGKAEIYLDSKLIAKKVDMPEGDLVVTIPPASGERILNILIETDGEKDAGIGGLVKLR